MMTITTPSTILFITTITTSTIFMLSSTTWLTLWIAMELNLMSMVPLFSINTPLSSYEPPIKYFLIQSASSAVIILSIMMSNLHYSQFITAVTLVSALLMKMGSAPFHFWLPQITVNSNWNIIMLVLTWQKIGPLAILSSLLHNWHLKSLTLLIMLNALMGSLGGLKQTQMRPLIAYSSITHTAWISTTFLMGPTLTLFYFTIYTMINLAVMIPMSTMTKSSTSKFSMTTQILPQASLVMLLNLLSLAGLPPFLGFVPKWTIIHLIVNVNNIILLTLIISSLLSLFFYLMVFYATLISTNKSSISLNSSMAPIMLSLTTIPTFTFMLFT